MDNRYFLRGEVDVSNADEQFALIYASSWLHTGDVTVDCVDLRCIDRAGLRALIALRDELRQQGRNLTLVQAPPFLVLVLEVFGLTELFARAHDELITSSPPRGLTAAVGLPARNN